MLMSNHQSNVNTLQTARTIRELNTTETQGVAYLHGHPHPSTRQLVSVGQKMLTRSQTRKSKRLLRLGNDRVTILAQRAGVVSLPITVQGEIRGPLLGDGTTAHLDSDGLALGKVGR